MLLNTILYFCWITTPEMPISGDLCHTGNAPPPPCTLNYTPPAVSPLNPSSPPKNAPTLIQLSFFGESKMYKCINNAKLTPQCP